MDILPRKVYKIGKFLSDIKKVSSKELGEHLFPFAISSSTLLILLISILFLWARAA